MAETVGFDYARIALIDENGKVVANKDKGLSATGIFKIDAPTSKGVISGAISGLAPTITKIWGSNQAVGVSGHGAGNVQVTLAVNDLPHEIVNKISGLTQDDKGAWVLDTNSVPPFAALELVSLEKRSNKAVHFVLYNGTFAPESRTLQTDTEQEQRATDSLTFTALNRASDGRVYAEYWESDGTEFNQEDLDNDVFQGAGKDASAPEK